MAIDFRCENCGKLLSVEAESSSKIKCPHCKAKVTVPAGLASLPRPQVPGDAGANKSRPDQPGDQIEEELPVGEDSDALMGVMATLMPWVISLFFHAGILVILAFFAIIVSQKKIKADIVVPDLPLSEDLGGQIEPGQMSPELTPTSIDKPDDQFAKRDSKIPMTNMGDTENKISLYGSAGGAAAGGASAPLGLTSGGGKGPKSRFCGTGGNAYHIVFVVDCSGSMLTRFDEVRDEMKKSITRMSEQQTFHIIFFAIGKLKENPPRRLVYANKVNKRAAVKYLSTITPEKETDIIPALKRAFAVLNRTPGKRKGKLLYLLTDGDFPDNEKVLSAIKTLNAKPKIQINTILYLDYGEEIANILRQIAKENKGKFKFVEQNE